MTIFVPGYKISMISIFLVGSLNLPFFIFNSFQLLTLVYQSYFQGDFREENFNTAMSVLRDAGDAAKGDQRGRRGGSTGKKTYFHWPKNVSI